MPDVVDSARVDAVIAEIDRSIASQVQLIREHPALRELERAWRALWFVVERVEPQDNIEVHMMQLEQLPPHLATAYELVIVLDEFDRGSEDMARLTALGALETPCVASLEPESFGKTLLEDGLIDAPEYESYRAFRESDAATHIVLTLNDVLVQDTWVPSSAAVAALVAESFARYRWATNIVDTPIPGLVAAEQPSSHLHAQLSRYGIVTPVATSLGVVFRSLHTAREPQYFGESEDGRTYELMHFAASQLPYRLIGQRLATYLRAIARESGQRDFELERTMNRWLDELVQPADTSECHFAEQMLRSASVQLRGAVMHLRFRPAMRLYAPHLEQPPYFTVEMSMPLST